MMGQGVTSCLVQDELEAKPLLAATFLETSADDLPIYTPVPSHEELKSVLDSKLMEHNESNPVMELVLFQQVNLHIPLLYS